MYAADTFQIPTDFKYRGEGNSSIVLSLPKTHQILRLRKRQKPKTILDWFVNLLKKIFNWDEKKEVDKETKNVMFYSEVMRKLLGNDFVCDAKQVFVSKQQIKSLDAYLIKFRPDNRKEKGLQHGQATIFHDYAFLPGNLSMKSVSATYAIEIKPKQTWIPIKQQKLLKCTFCTNQYLKLQKGQIEKLSEYCPFDLFSGESTRMTKAIRSLIENPQNNFRVFRNGVLLYGENQPYKNFNNIMCEWFSSKTTSEFYLQKFCNLVCAALLANFEEHSGDFHHKCDSFIPDVCPQKQTASKEKCLAITGDNLPNGCVLKKILSVQQLDLMGCQEYLKYMHDLDMENDEYINVLLNEIRKNPSKCPKCTLAKILRNCYHSPEETCKKLGPLFFVPYLIAAVARDCSIMLTFKEIENGIISDISSIKVLKSDTTLYAFNIGILDLYPKPMSTITKHCKRSEQILKAYRKLCIN